MAKQVINIGTEELAGDGESIRSAFNKVNENFTELYDDDAADFDGDYNSLTNLPTIPAEYTDADVQAKLGNVSGNIVPDQNIAYDIGSATARFRDLYLSGNTIDLGGATISSDGSTVALPQGSTIGGSQTPEVDLNIAPEVLEIQVDSPGAGQDTNWLWTWEQSTLPYARRTITNSNELNVPLYIQGTYTLNNFAKTVHGEMTQTHSIFLKWIEGAGTENLVSWATDQGTTQDSHPDINGGATQDIQRLSIVVPSTITLPALVPPTTVTYNVANNGAGAYAFSGDAEGDNVNIGPLRRGGTYTFNVTAPGHPFYLTTDNGSNYASGTYFGEYTNGVTGSRTDSGTVTFTVPADAPDTLYYQCGNHSPMRGQITVKDLAVETNINGNFVVYLQHGQEGHKTPVEIRPIPTLVNQMCLVYDASVNKFVPQDLATYVENTPSFENKIREVAGTAELVVEDGSAVVAKVNVYNDSTYLPLAGNNIGDQAFATDNNTLYVWSGTSWTSTKRQLVAGTNITLTTASNGDITVTGQPGYTDTDVGNYLSSNGYDTATNIVASITDSAPETLDTLNELAAALGDDPNFATTTANNIATKMPIAGGEFTGTVSFDDTVTINNGIHDLHVGEVSLSNLNSQYFVGPSIQFHSNAEAAGGNTGVPNGDRSGIVFPMPLIETIFTPQGATYNLDFQGAVFNTRAHFDEWELYHSRQIRTDKITLDNDVIVFEGASTNSAQTTLRVDDPTADRTITLPNASGTVMVRDANGVVTGGSTQGEMELQGTNPRLRLVDTSSSASTLQIFNTASGDDWYTIEIDNPNTIPSSALRIRIDLEDVAFFNTDGLLLTANNTLKFEGSTDDNAETTLTVEDPTQDRTITLPDKSGTVALTDEVASTGKAIAMAMIFGG